MDSAWEEEAYFNDQYEAHDHINVEEFTPRILLLGSRRSGKSSVANVVFNKLPPHETLFLSSTSGLDIQYVANNAFVQFQIWDFPGHFEFEKEELSYGGQRLTPQVVFGTSAAMVFVLDAQDEPFQDAIDYMAKTIAYAHSFNPSMVFEVFIHKLDGELFLTDEQKFDCQREIQHITNELMDPSLDIRVNYHLTSIYDHSILEAFSKVVQKLIPALPALENLLNTLIANCNMEKSFLFDVVSKIFIATDSNPVDMQTYELCSEMIDVVVDVSCIYGTRNKPARTPSPAGEKSAGGEGAMMGSEENSDVGEPKVSEDSIAMDVIPGGASESTLAYDSESASLIKLSNGMALYLREVNNYLALVCLLRAENITKRGLIDYNIDCFKKALKRVFKPDSEEVHNPSRTSTDG